MDWVVYNFDCGSVEKREAFLAWFEETHPTEIPEDEDHVFEEIAVDEETTRGANLAWVGDYVYVTVLADVGPLLEDTTDFWNRAVVAEFDSTTETCTEAVLYHTTADGIEDVTTYEGVLHEGGQDMMYRFAMTHQFRFRSYSSNLPTAAMIAHIPSAFVHISDPTEYMDVLEDLAEETGVEMTDEGLGFFREQPNPDD